jgi:hypothetical protein
LWPNDGLGGHQRAQRDHFSTVLWGPMAFAIMGGLFVTTMLTLLVLPVFYITLYRAKQPATTAAAI